MIITKEDFKQFLRKLGLRSGMNIVLDGQLNCELLIGGEKTVIDAIIEIIGYEATLLIPSFTFDLINPASQSKYLALDDMQNIDYSSYYFDGKKTLPNNLLATQLMVFDDSLRSNHPTHSFMAWGKYAQTVVSKHPLHFALAKNSPIAKMQELGAYYLNFSQTSNLFFDFVQSDLNNQVIKINTVPILSKEQKINKELLEYQLDRSKYQEVTMILLKEKLISYHQLHNIEGYFYPMLNTFPLIQLLLSK